MKYCFSSVVTILLLIAFSAFADGLDAGKLIAAARGQIGVTVGYDGAYRKIPYPGGDVAQTTGVCSDVVIRAYRALGLDLQKLVHEDMAKHFSLYPKQWGLKGPDTNIDHRRVPNLQVFFTRHGQKLSASSDAKDYAPGDIVTWDLHFIGSPLPHIGIVSDRRNDDGTPLVIHNIGGGAQEEDTLFTYRITGHYRYALKN
jgi:uncharacterized protein YijF (DUF1287 family)